VIFGLHIEVLLALAYALFLIGIAFSLELVARKSHKRAVDYRSAGFRYFREPDYFEFPAGHQLVQLKTDHERGVTSYRAAANACTSCPLKLNCTDSNEGRLLERRLDTWTESELRCFHRGVSLTLMLLATILILAEVVRYAQPGSGGVDFVPYTSRLCLAKAIWVCPTVLIPPARPTPCLRVPAG
jgi:hypothetical protein